MNRDFLLGFGAGCATAAIGGVVLVVGGLVLFGMHWTGPALAVASNLPEEATLGQPIVLELEVSNPHDTAIELDNVDIRDEVLQRFELGSFEPRWLGRPTPGLGSTTWFPERELEPGATETLRFELVPIAAGRQVLELELCNDYEDCNQVIRVVEVSQP